MNFFSLSLTLPLSKAISLMGECLCRQLVMYSVAYQRLCILGHDGAII